MSDDSFSLTSVVVLTLVIAVLASFILPVSLGYYQRHPPYQKKCNNNLKQMGVAMQMYFWDENETRMPMAYGTIRKDGKNAWNDLFEIDERHLKCPAKRMGRKKTYGIHPDASGGVLFSSIETSDSAIAGDTSVHRKGYKANILYGDGHVASSPYHILQINNHKPN